ncbi:hypothetical protein [Streptomyces sp. NPDC047014]|uniref:hypothetical protein n=1 Tax=Streptomyces sp. NPDC047014 TaxID=3155736 RepID=UPI0033F8B3DD
MAPSSRSLPLITRLVGGSICAYAPAPDARGVLSPVAVWRPSAGDEAEECAVPAGLGRACYTTRDAAVCLAEDGAEVWRSELEPRSDERFGHRPGCAVSVDGRVLWVYRPDVMAGRGRHDRWVALDAGNGAVLAQADLDTAGHGGEHLVHPADDHVLLCVGEGQDGAVVHRASVTPGRMDLRPYPWPDRVLIDLAPDGSQFMTVDHGQADFALHTYPDGKVTLTLSVDAFGDLPEESWVAFSGGYLDQDTVVVTLARETEEEQEWFRHYRVDSGSGRILGEFDSHAEHPYDIQLLGDGTWLTRDPSGHPVRRCGAAVAAPEGGQGRSSGGASVS